MSHFGRGDRLDHSKKATSHLGIGNRVTEPDQLDRLRALLELPQPSVFRAQLFARAFEFGEEVGHRDPEDVGDRAQARSADAVGAVLIRSFNGRSTSNSCGYLIDLVNDFILEILIILH